MNGKKKQKNKRHVWGTGYVVILALHLWAFTGCVALGPDYVKPSADLPGQWHSGCRKESSQDIQSLAAWWQTLDDPLLTDLINQAVAGNTDIQQAGSRVREARLERLNSRASFFPTLDFSASAKKNFSEDEDGSNVTSELYATGFDAGWELDLFGGVRRSVEAARADVEAGVEDYHDVMVTLLAEVAVNYIDLRTYQSRLAVAENNVTIQKETWTLLNSLAEAGLGDELDVAQAKYNLESTRANIPDLHAGLEAAMNRLAVLTGQPPGALHGELSDIKPLPEVTTRLAVGVPADVIRRRPDIRKAERELAAQTARIGVAKADLYPSLTLNGSIGLESLSADKLFSTGSRVMSFGPSLSLPIFNSGKIRNNIKIQEELQQQALIQYKASILSALEEVENALVAYAGEQQKIERLQAAAEAARTAANLAVNQYTTGMTDFNDVLDAQRSLLSFEDQLAESRGTVLTALVRLYKTLGGGWQTFDDVKEPENSKTGKDKQDVVQLTSVR